MKKMTRATILTLVAISLVSANIYAKKKDKAEKDTQTSTEVKSDDNSSEDDSDGGGSLKEGMKEVGQGFKGMGKSFKGAFNSVKDGVKGAFGGGSEDGEREDKDGDGDE